MTHCNTKLVSVIAVAAAAALTSSSTHAQYVTRYDRAPIYHSDSRAYAQAAFIDAPNIMYRGLYNTYAMVPSIYGCCWTNNIGMEGAVGR